MSTDDAADDYAALAALAEAALAHDPGPFAYADVESVGGGSLYGHTRMIAGMSYDGIHESLTRRADAFGEFYAAASPDVVRALIAEIRRLRGESNG